MKLRALFLLLACSLVSPLSHADVLDGISVMTLSAADGKVVVKIGSEPLSVVSVGDSLFGSTYVIKQVLPSKVLVKDSLDKGMGSLIWIHKAKSGLSSRVERIEEVTPEERVIAVPGTSEQ